jgi:S-formylglutathione hydrolase FrmB
MISTLFKATFVCLASLFIATWCGALAAKGAVITEQFYSSALGVEKNYRVYLPHNYETDKRRYPVIYLLHGWGATEATWTAPELDLAAAADRINLKAIVVMPDGDRSLYANSMTTLDYDACMNDATSARNKNEARKEFCVKTPRYEDYLVKDLISHVDTHFRTIATRNARALTGESAGGHGALQIALRHQDKFSSVANHSGIFALIIEGPFPYSRSQPRLRQNIDANNSGLKEQIDIYGTDFANWHAHDPYALVQNLKPHKLAIYFDCGGQDEFGFQHTAQYFRDRLRALKIPHHFVLVKGSHNETLWKSRIVHSLRFHVQQFRAAHSR